ncbi:F0F1 ATP synthase subunit delta [Blattabacterium cuenoti]|uniref:F0F1 ATP synthase subunit delta n=1 Tax=Blattabacterium cuenoti TaxID=1653831 RepID=UPI00163D2CA0|nr:F0F1 ATP synthase subunit delta [Blattabacterium cuenoti]
MVFNKKIIKHYAMILFDYINDSNHSKVYHRSIINLYISLQKNFLLKKLMFTFFIKKNEKIIILKKIINNIFLYHFIKILILNDRIFLIEKILLEYNNIYDIKKNNIIKCILTTTIPINKTIQKMIAKKIINKKKKFIIINNINKNIIGGFVFVQIKEYKEWDFSIKRYLNEINQII